MVKPWITGPEFHKASPAFRPVVSASPAVVAGTPPTRVRITTPNTMPVGLVATFSPTGSVSGGVKRVAGTQTVTTTVDLQFSKVLPLTWMASVMKIGDLAPNQRYSAYASDADSFVMQLNAAITLTHENGAWHIPAFDTTQYTVNVGFGLGTTYIGWAFSLECQPLTAITLGAGSYELVKWNGQEQIGDPVVPTTQGDWVMPMGFAYTLTFDASGNGVLTQ